MLRITDSIAIPLSEIDITQVRSSGPGGQNVNKVANGIHLRFDIMRLFAAGTLQTASARSQRSPHQQ
jgi:protein subunit release factor B